MTDPYDLDATFLRSSLSFQEPYNDADHAKNIRRHWRSVARKNRIRIRTFDFTTGKSIIIQRLTELPGDERVRDMHRDDAREKLNRYLAEQAIRDE
jgi:hypothetical protein